MTRKTSTKKTRRTTTRSTSTSRRTKVPCLNQEEAERFLSEEENHVTSGFAVALQHASEYYKDGRN